MISEELAAFLGKLARGLKSMAVATRKSFHFGSRGHVFAE
jgi:hypothetical protein